MESSSSSNLRRSKSCIGLGEACSYRGHATYFSKYMRENKQMHVIGEAKGIKIYSPKDAYFSYFNSPYTAHSQAAAIDIYPHHQKWGGPVASPVSGKIVRIQKTKMGRKKKFPTEEYDVGIAIQPEETEIGIVRIMHCDPILKERDNVDLGDNNFTVNATTLHVDTNTGMVGIGTSSPDVKLDIYSNSASSGLRLRGPTPTSEIGDIYVDAGGNFNIDTRSGTEAGYIAIRPEDADYGMLLFETDGGTSAFANFAVIDGTSDYLNIVVGATDSTIGLVVDSNDNVGIGTITPQRKLHVNGSILSNATINQVVFVLKTNLP